jgi:threonine/homoserine/homoserine lactone efflux protein
VQIAVGITVNALIVLAAGSIAGLLKRRPAWAKWQRWATGSLLGAVAIALAREVPARARA